MSVEVTLGEGVLNWPCEERVTDRYGQVLLEETAIAGVPIGERGRLCVEVIEGNESSHLGDVFRGFHQRRVLDAGERVFLGAGTLFADESSGGVGVEPIDGRRVDWLDPETLYDVHESVVRLYFEMEV